MDDSVEGSSAAQRAQSPEETSQRGFLSRIFNALTPAEAEERSPAAPTGRREPALPVLGLQNLRRRRVADVMVPNADLVAVEVDSPLPEVIAVFREHGFSRMPVYEDRLDRPLGLLLLKDLALKYGFNGHGDQVDLRELLRPILYVPPSMPLFALLQKMRVERTHMALVIDEYGGVDGLVTIEDLIEEVVGEIEDEHDIEEGALWVQERPGVYLVEARTPLDAFEAEIGMTLAEDEEEEEVDTLGGLVFLLSGRVPETGEVIEHESGARFEVVEAEPRRITRLRVRLPAAAAG